MKRRTRYILFILPLVIEIFVCNANFWIFGILHRGMECSLITNEFYGEGLQQEQADQNIFRIADSQSGQYYFEFNEINQKTNSIYLDIKMEGSDYVRFDIYAKDDGNIDYYHIPSDGSKYIIVPEVKESKWFQTQFYGNLQSLKIQFKESDMMAGKKVEVSEISINKPKEMHISLFRIGGIELFLILLTLYKKGGRHYKRTYIQQERRHKICIGIVVLLNMLLFAFFIDTIKPYSEQKLTIGSGHEQYQKLAKAMADGHVYLNDKVPDWLLNMENPYDTSARRKLVNETGEWYLWDNAYYGGHYYVYFGVIPVLLCYLPYYLLFHADLPNYIPILLSWIVICAASARLIGAILKKWFPNFPYILYLLLVAIFPSSIGAVVILQRPTIYEVPISMGVMFAVLGLDLWLESVKDGEIVSIPKIVAGSVCIACIAGCRPNIFVVFLFCFLIFGKFIVRDKKICIQKYWQAAVAFSIPFLIVAAGLMYYNWIRFDSVFDFGSNYNLTLDDLTKRGFHLSRIGLALFEFIWKPFALSPKFPFIKVQGVESAYMGRTIAFSGTGGILMCCPFFLFAVVLVIWNKKLRQYKQPFQSAVLSIILAISVTVITTNLAGICPRYKADIGFLIGIASVIAACMLYMYLETVIQSQIILQGFQQVLFWICMVSILLNFLSFFATLEYSLQEYNPRQFYMLKYIFEFWK